MTKPTKKLVRPAKTQISLGICPVWSESSLCAQWVDKDPMFLHVDSKDSDQTGQKQRLWSDWADAQAESSLGAHSFCHSSFMLHFLNVWSTKHLIMAILHKNQNSDIRKHLGPKWKYHFHHLCCQMNWSITIWASSQENLSSATCAAKS